MLYFCHNLPLQPQTAVLKSLTASNMPSSLRENKPQGISFQGKTGKRFQIPDKSTTVRFDLWMNL
jgi:hypothetical protein